MSEKECPVCGSMASETINHDPVSHFYICPVCGRYEYFPAFAELTGFNLNHLSAYLAYNGFKRGDSQYRYYSTASEAECEIRRKEFRERSTGNGCSIHLSAENVENWYPKTFSEKIDNILLYFNSKTLHWGTEISLNREELFSCLFVERYDYNESISKKRTDDELLHQAGYMVNYLLEQKLIDSPPTWSGSVRAITLAPAGYARIDALQKNISTGKNALVAMKFGDDTKPLREAIRKGVIEAGYNAIFIDEVEHIDFITPELLKYIRDSKFVVADLTHENNGAYFEEGYAMGLGKPVIQLCKKGVNLHFDIAQKNTIMWETEEEISERLKNRIIATIE